MRSGTHLRRLLAAAAALVVLAPALAQESFDFDFMPKGGKALFVEVFGARPDAPTLDAIMASARSEADWSAFLASRTQDLSDRELETLAAYLAVNMPLGRGAVEAATVAGDISAALPPDGRELAWNGCQGCHSLFTSHLTQDRDVQAWLNMFNSPFHRELRMTPQEREEFSRYSAINMPMKLEDVPEDLRF